MDETLEVLSSFWLISLFFIVGLIGLMLWVTELASVWDALMLNIPYMFSFASYLILKFKKDQQSEVSET